MQKPQNEYIFKTKAGWQKITYSRKGVTALTFPVKQKPVLVPQQHPKFVRQLAKELKKYFSGKGGVFSCPFELENFTEFQKTVWKTATKIPYGETRSYSWLAKKAGIPGSARAAGSALGKNPCPIIIPCHRVVKSDGTLGGFSGPKGWKKKLLDLENSNG